MVTGNRKCLLLFQALSSHTTIFTHFLLKKMIIYENFFKKQKEDNKYS